MSDTHDVKKEVATYYKVFFALGVCTIITVALKNLNVGITLAVVLAMIVATLKASLVASFFMHLKAEKDSIYLVLGFTVFFFAGLIILTIASFKSKPHGTENLNYNYKQEFVIRDEHHGVAENHEAAVHIEAESKASLTDEHDQGH